MRESGRPNFYSSRPKDRPAPDPRFHFDYDFDKHQVDPLGSVFGLPKWDVEDAAVAWIRHYDAKVGSMYDCPRPRWSSEDRNYGSTSFPATDLYGGQLAWHSIMLAAGQFAKERPVSGESWQEAPWESWLSEFVLSRDEGLWLADGTDLFPLEDRHSIIRYRPVSGKAAPVPLHPLELLPLAGFNDSLALPTTFLVSGRWELVDGLDITIGSQLVDRAHARTVAHAVYSGDPFFAYLPVNDEGEEGIDRREARERELLTRWLSSDRHTYTKLDSRDPMAFATALQRARPSAETIKTMDLRQSDPFGRDWLDSTGKLVFRAEAWGTRKGRGRHETERGGTRLSVNRESLGISARGPEPGTDHIDQGSTIFGQRSERRSLPASNVSFDHSA